jgi:uncharacterized metal-binding protein
MPSGVVHAQCSLVLAVPAFAVAYVASQQQVDSGLACAVGCLAGTLLTPDLDQETISRSEYTLIKWTMGLGFLWAMLWYPYARLCKHRSALSHWPLLGTCGRLLYLGIFVGLALYWGWTPPPLPQALLWWGALGLMISDTAHWALDMWSGERPRRKRPARR